MSSPISNVRPEFDQPLIDIVDYVLHYKVESSLAYETARYCLLDTLGCGLQALDFPACTKLLGPLVPGLTMKNGARVPGTSYELDPVQAAFNIGAIIRSEHGCRQRKSLMLTQAFIASKEERLVVPDWPSHGSAKVIALQCGLRCAFQVEEVACIERVVAQIIEHLAMKLVRAGAGAEAGEAGG